MIEAATYKIIPEDLMMLIVYQSSGNRYNGKLAERIECTCQ